MVQGENSSPMGAQYKLCIPDTKLFIKFLIGILYQHTYYVITVYIGHRNLCVLIILYLWSVTGKKWLTWKKGTSISCGTDL